MLDDSSVTVWTAPFEAFFQRAELRQTLRALQVEAIAFPFAPGADFDDALRSLCTDIYGYLASRAELLKKAAQPVVEHPSADNDAVRKDGSNIDDACDRYSQDMVQSTITREQTQQMMDDFVDRQWVEINSNNREEFLIPAAGRETTCARADAKETNRGMQIQLDIVHNDRNALERSTNTRSTTAAGADTKPVNSVLYAGLEERVENIRDHMNVRFVPESAGIHRRVCALEDRIMMLEREFPPWAAENFNQPGRRHTQPPPVTVYRILPSAEPAAVTTTLSGLTAAAAPILPQNVAVPRSLPATASSAGLSASRPMRAHVSQSHSSFSSAAYQHQKSTKHRRGPSGNPSGRSLSAPKRRKTGGNINSPLDRTGKPIFHACGRGVNSSLTRSVLAQLQTRHKPASDSATADTNNAAASSPQAPHLSNK
ncbi:hypothetical protein GGF37_003033 [Kickxella alabastrina]|nr:hypothetical protein GGF37_003033 [Kickxella alabastrina]